MTRPIITVNSAPLADTLVIPRYDAAERLRQEAEMIGTAASLLASLDCASLEWRKALFQVTVGIRERRYATLHPARLLRDALLSVHSYSTTDPEAAQGYARLAAGHLSNWRNTLESEVQNVAA